MSDKKNKPNELTSTEIKLFKDYLEFGKIEVIDITNEVEDYDILGATTKRD